jgi:hypothetical protein
MKIQHPGGFRLLAWTGTALLLAVLGGPPREAAARFYQPQDPPYPDGDPTADDQPSPTPKLNRNYFSTTVRTDARGAIVKISAMEGRWIWLSFVRAWIRISVF